MRILVLTTGIGNTNGWTRYSEGLVGALTARGVVCDVVTQPRLPDPLRLLYAYVFAPWHALTLVARARKATLIHAHTETYAPIAYVLSLLTRRPYVVTAHGTYGVLALTMSPLIALIHRRTFAAARKVVCVSTYTHAALAQHGFTNLAVIGNGITLTHTGSVLPFERRDELMITVGSVMRRKGAHFALEAFGLVAREFPTLRYEIIGAQNGRVYVTKLRARAEELGLTTRVTLIDHCTDSVLAEKYRSAKLFVMTSISTPRSFEGFGLVYLEANIHGTPVIGATATGAVDAIENGRTGVLVPQDDPQATARAIQSVLRDPEGWNRMSARALAWAKEHDWSNMAIDYATLYKLI